MFGTLSWNKISALPKIVF